MRYRNLTAGAVIESEAEIVGDSWVKENPEPPKAPAQEQKAKAAAKKRTAKKRGACCENPDSSANV